MHVVSRVNICGAFLIGHIGMLALPGLLFGAFASGGLGRNLTHLVRLCSNWSEFISHLNACSRQHGYAHVDES